MAFALANNKPSIAKHLLASKGNIESCMSEGCNLVDDVIRFKNPDILKILLEHKISANSVNPKTGSTPLIVAMQNASFDCLRVLVDSNVSINAVLRDESKVTKDESTPLMQALKNTEVVQALISLKANVNTEVESDSYYAKSTMKLALNVSQPIVVDELLRAKGSYKDGTSQLSDLLSFAINLNNQNCDLETKIPKINLIINAMKDLSSKTNVARL